MRTNARAALHCRLTWGVPRTDQTVIQAIIQVIIQATIQTVLQAGMRSHSVVRDAGVTASSGKSDGIAIRAHPSVTSTSDAH